MAVKARAHVIVRNEQSDAVSFAPGQELPDWALAQVSNPAVLGEAAEGDVPAGPFDPTKHSVSDVLEHLKGADEEELARVLEAEAAGDSRKTIMRLSVPDDDTANLLD